MDDVLARLLELSEDAAKPAAGGGARPDQAVLTEAQHLWKTLETLTATQKAVELQVHDATFSRLLACIHCVLKAPRTWTAGANGGSTTTNGTNKSIFELANRVLVKVGCRGEQEREAILRDGFAPLLVESALGSDASRLSSSETVALLHNLQTLAFDTQHRIDLMKCDAVRAALSAMRRFPSELSVQVFGGKFLQFMAYEEAVKEIIIDHDGIEIVLEALSFFGSDVQLATSASDMLYFLSLDLENAFASQETKYVSTTQAIMSQVIRLMRTHRHVQPVQVHGIAILLTFAGSHASARLYLSSHDASSSLWEIATGTAVTNDDAMTDTIDLLEIILEAPECFQQLQSDVSARGTSQDASAQMCALHCLSTLISCLESKLNRAQYASKSQAIGFVIDRLRSLVESVQTRHSPSPVEETEHDDVNHRLQVSDHPRGIHPQSRRASWTTSQPSRLTEDDQASDDSHRFLDDESPTKDANSPYGCFDEFVRDHDDSRDGDENESVKDLFSELGHPEVDIWSGNKSECLDASPHDHHADQKRAVARPTDWQKECEHVRRRHKELEGEYHLLQQNYQILLRRAQEQSKLLNIQNARIKHHMDVHQHVLDRVRTLETALADAQRKHQVERELRLAEVAQSEKISSSLHEAMKEITTLNRQNSTASRELQQKEKLRVDYQQKVSAVRQQQQKLEFERDDAVVQMLSMRSEQLALSKKLEESRREAEEALRMREEDIDAPKLSAFSEMLSLSPSARLRKVSSYTLTTKRVAAEASERQQRHQEHRKSMFAGSINRVVRPVDASLMRKASMYGGQVLSDRSIRSADVMVIDGQVHEDDHDDEYMMEPPKDDISTTSGSNPFPQRGLDKFEIERTLRVVYDGFDKSPESNGVHVATIRRFFADCGIVQPPLVAGDVDTILTRVLNQAQENRKRVMIRKDFTISTFPGGIGSGSSQKRATEAKRFRFFDVESFFEAVTLLVMRRFPRFEAKKALEVFITDYLHPMQRQQQQQQLLLLRRSSSSSSTAGSGTIGGNAPTRSGSIVMSSGSSGNTSPTAACIGILKSVLNGLALHIGRDDDGGLRHEDPLFLSKQDNSATTILLASGHHNRKPRREDVVYSMLEMHAVLAREYKPLATVCEFYSTMHHTPRDALLKEDGFAMPLTFELLLAFAMDFEIIPSFMDRLSLKHLHSEVSAYLKTYMTLQKKLPPPHAIDTEMLKKVAFSMALARLAMELFGTKREYETPEKQITALLQWLDNSVGREKIQKKAMLPIVIKFSRKLYAIRA